jgi:hypothetical protein
MNTKTPVRLYVGCALTLASEEFKASVEAFKDRLRAEGYEVFDFLGLVEGTIADVYKWDIGHCIGDCDIFLAICDLPSIGLGYELCEAVRLKKPVLAVAHKDTKVTRLLLGAAEVEPNLHFERYDELTDVIPMLGRQLAAG